MLHNHRKPIAIALALAHFNGTPTFAQDASDATRVTAYPASFFEKAQPYSAFDMLILLPGYTFNEGDPDVRGFAGAAGNLLIDGARPASKHESLESQLRRIPANTVERIELIRPGARGVDMQGQTVLANVVRLREAQAHGALEVASAVYERGILMPRIAGEIARGFNERMVELSAAHDETVGDEHGVGSQSRTAPNGAVLRDAQYSQDEREHSDRFAAAYEQHLTEGKLRANGSYMREVGLLRALEEQTFPEAEIERVRERERQTESEIGLRYDIDFGERLQLELLGLHRGVRERETEEEVAADESSSFRQSSNASESIIRGVLRSVAERWTVEAGIETARNVLDSRSELYEDGAAVALPASRVRVEERRTEAFAMTTWRMSAQWTLEAGSRFESSELIQEGDSDARESFVFAKPRVLLSLAPTHDNQWRLLIERSVGQLDFDDFVTSMSLSTDTVTAGNPDLEPDRTWTAELAWERQFMTSGALVLTARREHISDLIDRVPIDNDVLIEGVGNIGDGVRNEIEISLSVPLAPLGLESGLLKATALWRSSRATDPVTGERRTISEDAPFDGAVHFTHNVPAWNIHWGIDAELASEVREFMIDEVRTERFGTRVDLFVEYEPAPPWKIRVSLNNLTNRSFNRERRIFEGARGSTPVSYVEIQTLRMGPYAGVSLRRSFGR